MWYNGLAAICKAYIFISSNSLTLREYIESIYGNAILYGDLEREGTVFYEGSVALQQHGVSIPNIETRTAAISEICFPEAVYGCI